MGKSSSAKKEKRVVFGLEVPPRFAEFLPTNVTFTGDPVQDRAKQIAVQTVAFVRAHLEADRSPATLVKITRALLEAQDAELTKFPKSALFQQYVPPRRLELACREGCDYCCRGRVVATAPQILFLADYLRRKRTPEELESVIADLRDYEKKTGSLSPLERLHTIIDCPFLKDRRCSAYVGRPEPCRFHHSYDLSACLKGFEESDPYVPIPQDVGKKAIRAGFAHGMERGFSELSYELRELEFAPAMIIALEEPAAAAKWLAGEDVFASAYRPEISEVLMNDFRQHMAQSSG